VMLFQAVMKFLSTVDQNLVYNANCPLTHWAGAQVIPLSIYFKMSKKKTSIDPNIICEEIFPNLFTSC
jgi:hypothetical protein